MPFKMKSEKSPHRITHGQGILGMPVAISSLAKGDVFLRQGAPHMFVEISNKIESKWWIVNLLTGSCWQTDGEELVVPAFNVDLNYKVGKIV